MAMKPKPKRKPKQPKPNAWVYRELDRDRRLYCRSWIEPVWRGGYWWSSGEQTISPRRAATMVGGAEHLPKTMKDLFGVHVPQGRVVGRWEYTDGD